MNNPRGFASDNNSGVHPRVMDAILKANDGHVVAYGGDPYTDKATQKFKEIFGSETEVFFVYNGTGANVLALKTVTESWHSILCSEVAHVNEDECSAPEKITGCKLIALPHRHGKISVKDIAKHLVWLDDEHRAQPKVVSITQCTEMGAVYTVEEIQEIVNFCHSNNLLVHMDGARIANAAVALNMDFKECTKDLGIDILSFGGTKNGMMFGEAVLFFNPDLVGAAKYYRKQNMQLNSKMRFIAAQFIEYLNEDVWRPNAVNANKMAQELYKGIKSFDKVEVVHPVEANGVFAKIPADMIPVLQKEMFFYVFDELENMVRWMCSWDTRPEDIQKFCERLAQLDAVAD